MTDKPAEQFIADQQLLRLAANISRVQAVGTEEQLGELLSQVYDLIGHENWCRMNKLRKQELN